MSSEGSNQSGNVNLQWHHRFGPSQTATTYKSTAKAERDPALCVLNSKCPMKMYPSTTFDGIETAEESHAFRRKQIKAHLRNHHNIECYPNDTTLVNCVACPIVNGATTKVEIRAFPEHINTFHQPPAQPGKPQVF